MIRPEWSVTGSCWQTLLQASDSRATSPPVFAPTLSEITRQAFNRLFIPFFLSIFARLFVQRILAFGLPECARLR